MGGAGGEQPVHSLLCWVYIIFRQGSIKKHVPEENSLHFHPLWPHLPHLTNTSLEPYLSSRIMKATLTLPHVRETDLPSSCPQRLGRKRMRKGGLQGDWRESVSLSPSDPRPAPFYRRLPPCRPQRWQRDLGPRDYDQPLTYGAGEQHGAMLKFRWRQRACTASLRKFRKWLGPLRELPCLLLLQLYCRLLFSSEDQENVGWLFIQSFIHPSTPSVIFLW